MLKVLLEQIEEKENPPEYCTDKVCLVSTAPNEIFFSSYFILTTCDQTYFYFLYFFE